MRSAFERETESQMATDYAIRTSLETGAPAFLHGDPFTHHALAKAAGMAHGNVSVGAIGGYRATTYTGGAWVVTAIEAP